MNENRPTYAEINLQQLSSNLKEIRNKVNSAQVMPVLKANAYGHGLVEVALHLETENCCYYGLALVEEALELRKHGIKTPLLVFGSFFSEQIDLFLKHDITLTISSYEQLTEVESAAEKINKHALVHLKIDTGMGRIGFQLSEDFDKLFSLIKKLKWTTIEGVYSHFASSESKDLSFSLKQLHHFKEFLEYYKSFFGKLPIYQHIANSGGILNLPDSYFNLVRPGVLFYGSSPSHEPIPSLAINIKPALSWKTRIAFTKTVPVSTPISYGSRWTSPLQTRIATLPVGYGDGYHRHMTGKAQVLIHGKLHNVVGTICMDQIMVDLKDTPAKAGDEVLLLGAQKQNHIFCENLAKWSDTVSHEVFTSINQRVSRKYVR